MSKNAWIDFQKRIHEDYNIPTDKVGKAIVDAIAFSCNHGFVEYEPIKEKYSEYFCEWDGRLHYPTHECKKQLAEFKKGQK